ncbi:TPA: SOS response-associated peptidase family protein, partial [Enterobacter ludwigii]
MISPNSKPKLASLVSSPFGLKTGILDDELTNARSETVSSKPSFRDAWKKGQHCVILASG